MQKLKMLLCYVQDCKLELPYADTVRVAHAAGEVQARNQNGESKQSCCSIQSTGSLSHRDPYTVNHSCAM